LHSLSKQARDKGFSVNSDEIRKSYSEELATAASFIKSSEEHKTKDIYNGIQLEELSDLIDDCQQSVHESEAD